MVVEKAAAIRLIQRARHVIPGARGIPFTYFDILI